MHDIFELFIQTVYASSVGLFILFIKRLFRDKLPPVWQFGVWSIFAAALVIPYSVSGVISFSAELLKTFITGEHSVSKPLFFFPVTDFSAPENISELIFLIYFSGVVIFIIRYAVSFVRLKIIASGCEPISAEKQQQLSEIANKYRLTECKAVTMQGLSAPFVFGLIKPVLIIPEEFPDEKIILHELIHLKYKDVLWGFIIAVFRSIHWCNPFLWYCFNKINNDIEELCDSRVLSLIEGEQRREYGNLLLSMANKKYASCIGTTSIANGGKNIRSRIRTIVRFRRYPANNSLICICITVIMASFLLIQVNAKGIPEQYIKISDASSVDVALSASRSYFCTTPAAALDTYGKSVLQNNGIYRAAAAPLSLHNNIRSTIIENISNNNRPFWDAGVDGMPTSKNNYYIYNLESTGKDEYTAYLVFSINFYDPDENSNQKIAYQKLKVYKEDFRWVVTEESDFDYVITYKMQGVWGCDALPTYIYKAEVDDFILERHYQLCFNMNSDIKETSRPVLDADFYEVYINTHSQCIYTGPTEKKVGITSMRFSCFIGEEKENVIGKFLSDPELIEKSEVLKKVAETIEQADYNNYSHSSSDGSSSASTTLSENWSNVQTFGGGGHTSEYKKDKTYLPSQVNGKLFINGEIYAEAVLERVN